MIAKFKIIILIFLILLVGCSQYTTLEFTEVPTITLTPSATSTITPTFTPTSTFTPSPTPEPWVSEPISLTSARDVRQARVWGKGKPLSINYASNLLLVQTIQGAFLYDTDLNQLKYSDPDAINSTLSNDGSLLASVHIQGSNIFIHVLDVSANEILINKKASSMYLPKDLPIHDHYVGGILAVRAIAISPDNNWVVAGFADGNILVFSISSNFDYMLTSGMRIENIVISPNSKFILVENDYNKDLFEIGKVQGKLIGKAEGQVFSPDNSLIAGIFCGKILIFSIEENKLLVDKPTRPRYTGICGEIVEVSFSEDGQYVILEYPDLNERQIRRVKDGEIEKRIIHPR